MDDVPWWLPVLTLVLGAFLAEIRALIDRRQRARHDSEMLTHQLAHERASRLEDFEEQRRRDREAFSRETLLSLDDAVHQFTQTVVKLHLEQDTAVDRSERWWQVHVTGAREVRRLLARVHDETLITLVRATLEAGQRIIHAQERVEHVAAMGLTQDNAGDVSDRIGELLGDLDSPPWPLTDSQAPGDGRYVPQALKDT